MRAGQIVEEGLTKQVLSDPQSDYTRELLAANSTSTGVTMADPLDDFIDAAALPLSLPLKEDWKPR